MRLSFPAPPEKKKHKGAQSRAERRTNPVCNPVFFLWSQPRVFDSPWITHRGVGRILPSPPQSQFGEVLVVCPRRDTRGASRAGTRLAVLSWGLPAPGGPPQEFNLVSPAQNVTRRDRRRRGWTSNLRCVSSCSLAISSRNN